MANTRFLKEKVESYVRTWLTNKFGKPFHKDFLPFTSVKDRPATVSEDRKIDDVT